MESPMPFDRISDLIGMIYDCTLDVGRYTATLEAVRTETNFCNAALQIWTDRYRNPGRTMATISSRSGAEPSAPRNIRWRNRS